MSADDFYIYVYFSNGGHAYDQSSVTPTSNWLPYRSAASAGESFYKSDGLWVDLYDNMTINKPQTANFCIKGLCDDDSSGFDIVFLQSGVGSWAASYIWYCLNRFGMNRPKIVLVEPSESCGVFQSFTEDKRISPLGSLDTIMAGLNCGIPSKNAWEIIKNGCDAVITISDEDVKSSMRILYSPKENDPKIKKLLDEVKDREFIGYSYDGADASFELLARRIISKIPRYILIKEYDVSVKKDSSGAIVSSAKAQLEVDGEKIMCTGEGNGPVNALDNAIRQNVDRLNKYSKYLKDLKLVDYKVRILNTGTEAITRVSIESTDSKGKNWFTIGVSANIIDASFKALVDSLDYKLFKDNAPASL